MNSFSRIYCFLFFLSIYYPVFGKNYIIFNNWSFHLGTKIDWTDTAYNDKQWNKINLTDFIASKSPYTIRSKFFIDNSIYKDTLELLLGKFNEKDSIYFNGKKLEKLSVVFKTNYNRDEKVQKFIIHPNLVNWGGLNTIVVFIHDIKGYGFSKSSYLSLSKINMSNPLSIEESLNIDDHIFKESESLPIRLKVFNNGNILNQGTLTCKLFSDLKEFVSESNKSCTINPNDSICIEFIFKGIKPGFYQVINIFEGSASNVCKTFNIGVEPEKVVAQADTQADFSLFWQKTKLELSKINPQFNIQKIDSFCTPEKDCFLVEMHSLDNIVVRGWYQTPKSPGKYPAILNFPGFSASQLPSKNTKNDSLITFKLNIRGHGNSKDSINPGFYKYPSYLLYNIEDKNSYIYRGAYMDCIRAIDFLYTRPEVDTTKVMVDGGSQGGALSFATAALDNKRISAVLTSVPFLSDFPNYFKIANWPANEFSEWLSNHPQNTWDEIFKTLSYFDIKNLAFFINAPLIMGSGLMDDICPPRINFAAYNNVKAKKEYIVYPYHGHNMSRQHYAYKILWGKQQLGIYK